MTTLLWDLQKGFSLFFNWLLWLDNAETKVPRMMVNLAFSDDLIYFALVLKPYQASHMCVAGIQCVIQQTVINIRQDMQWYTHFHITG